MVKRPAVRVVSWNVHAWRGTDGREEPERIGRVLRCLCPDIAGLQEVANRYDGAGETHQLARIARQSGMTPVNGPTIVRLHGDYGNALLTRLPVQQVRHNREPRAALDVDLEAFGRPLRVIVTHFGLRPAERRFQVRRLIQAIEARSFEALVLMGDLNEWLIFGRPVRWLRRHFGQAGVQRTFPSRFPLFALDRIFVQPPQALEELRCVSTPETREASDHLPLVARVQPF